MELIGILTGEYQGQRYAKVICTETFEGRAGCYGTNAVISKAKYDYVKSEIIPQIDLYIGSKVRLFYDQYGKVIEIKIV